MADPDLERVRRKVEDGERLTEPELSLLERAARGSSGPSLRLSVAHALMNAEADRQALPILDALERDFPREVQVRLGRARALMALDRLGGAERTLGEALALNPGDPEALKAVAALALRRGEYARARFLVGEALERDPFDGEARMLKEELEASGPEPHALAEPASLAEFTRALLDRLRNRRVPHVRRGGDVLVRLDGGRVARVNLRSLFASYVADGGSLEEVAKRLASELGQMTPALPATREALLERALPVLRPPGFTGDGGASAHREGPAGLLVYYALEDPDLVRYVPEALLGELSVRLDELDAAAFSNLSRSPAPPQKFEASPLWAIARGDGHDHARLLVAGEHALLEQAMGAPPYRVHLGRRELAVLCRQEDAAAAAQLDRLGCAPEGIPGRFRLSEAGRLEPC